MCKYGKRILERDQELKKNERINALGDIKNEKAS